MGRWLWVGLALLAAGSAAFGRDVTRRVEMLFPGRYRLTLKNNQMGSVQVLDDRSRPVRLEAPGDSAELAKADDGSATTWQMGFQAGPGRTEARCDLELAQIGGTLKVPFSVALQAAEPRVRVSMPVGAYDDMLVVDGRSYFIIGPVTLVEDTGDQDVLIAIGR